MGGMPRWIRNNPNEEAKAKNIKALWNAVQNTSSSMPKTPASELGVGRFGRGVIPRVGALPDKRV
jgi:hypothetical protein